MEGRFPASNIKGGSSVCFCTGCLQESHIRGSVHATERAWEGILHPTNCIEDPEQPTDFPPEEGPFKFVPNRYTRKQ